MSNPNHRDVPGSEKVRQRVSALLKKREAGREQNETIPTRPVYSPSPASFGQRSLWFAEQVSPGNAYNLQIALRLKQKLNLDCVHAAWQEILKRHEVLRTTFRFIDNEVMQFISPELKPSMRVIDLTGSSFPDHESQVRDLLEKEEQQNFDLAAGPLVRPVLCKLGQEEYTLCFTMHHIIADGWSLGVLLRELTELYAAFSEGRPNPLPPLAIQYADFAWWQRQWLSGDRLEKQLSYWRRQLSNPPILELPADHPRNTTENRHGAQWDFQISAELRERLRELGRRNQASLFMVLLAAWKVLLCHYSGQTDIIVGAPIANRTRVEIESLIGFFVNTLVLRTDLSGNPSFKEMLSRVKATTLDAYDHQDVPYEELVVKLRPDRNAGHAPFFTTMLNWVNTPGLDVAETPSEAARPQNPAARFDLALHIMETNGALPARLEYSADLSEETTIKRMSEHFQNLLAGIVATNADKRLSELPLLSPEECHLLLYGWNQGVEQFPTNETILELLEDQACKTQDRAAVVCKGETWTYGELHQRANQLAHFLKKMG
ncbi:MAG TPA: condensation domain-containing protein, partial [Candidatus Angelobacter sp.]|nr:condensation domain-containing protein [Candidatus Angelobacter sp.]